ncbi:sensor domain-containing diguanylate cyclase [Shewanella aestuarii]|uniref:Diguanylate cyclase n=1 Tax=Shewanella aestuarii TaxID=1028752 RepID=A0A6G9QJM1_9GAMM|nr:diguanylate cyclase [Shewanella aestuarii]QIR14672.1 diguanylate cyclase [Shewanella aestuarii]
MENNPLSPFEIVESLFEGVVIHSATTEIIYANPRALEILRVTENQVLNKDVLNPKWHFLCGKGNALAFEDYPVNIVIRTKQPIFNVEVGFVDKSSGDITWILCNTSPKFNQDGTIKYIISSFIDITSRKVAVPLEAVVANANDIIIITKANTDDPQIVYVNAAFTKLTGYEPDEAIGKTPRFLQGPNTDKDTRSRIRDALRNSHGIRETIVNYTKTGVPYWLDINIFPLKNSLGQITYFAAVERDVTNEVIKVENLTHLALEDPLTGLLNRRGFEQAVTNTFADKNFSFHTLALIDIDYFKNINDTHGHDVGDIVLTQLANLLKKFFRDSDLICRFGGEEFIVLMQKSDINNSLVKFEQFRTGVKETSFSINKQLNLSITVSLGLIQIPSSDIHLESHIKNADIALYQAKRGGRNRIQVFEF